MEQAKSYGEIDLRKELKEIFGFNTFKQYQQDIVMDLLNRKDVVAIMPTGGGKSLCFQLPALIMDGTAIVISPLIALMKNQVDIIRHIACNRQVSHFLNSSLNKHEINKVKQDVLSNKTKMLYVAPESLVKQENIDFLKQVKLSFFAIDEAHCISEWGHDFRPEYRRIREIINSIGQNVPVIALTATATEKVRADIMKNLDIEQAKVYISSFNRPNLYYEVRQKPKEERVQIYQIIKFIKENPNKSGIIYCLARKKVESVAQMLSINGIKALPYHAGLDAATRAKTQDMFLKEYIDVIVATIAFGMGIDKPDVRYVIHYDMPKSLEGYYQETGRAGRDGGEGKCLAFYSEHDMEKLERLLTDKTMPEREAAIQLMEAAVSYAESSVCRRKTLMKYFGEDYTEDCGNCDNCLNPKKKTEASEDIKTALEVIQVTGELFKADHIINIILGIANGTIKTCRHNKLEYFGVGKNKSESYWRAVVRQCILEGFVKKDIENYGLLKLMPKAQTFIWHPYDILISEDHDYANMADEEDNMINMDSKASAGDMTLFTILKDIRKSIADKEDLPPYVIFEDRSLIDMTIQYPTTIESMKNISGVGEAKAKKYGQQFALTIAKYVKDNEIEVPQEFIIKTSAGNSALKIYIIKSIDKKLALEDIAKGKNLSMDELLLEIERIIRSGTKLDISYYIQDTVDEYHQQEIMDCLKQMQTDSIQKVLDELDDDEYTEQEVRLIKIMFLNNYGQ